MVASGLKIRLPGLLVTLSMNYVVVIASLLSMNASAGIIVGFASAIGQCCIYATRRPRWFQVVFSTSAMVLPILMADGALHSRFLALADPTGCLGLMGASLAYFFMNTVIVAGIISSLPGGVFSRRGAIPICGHPRNTSSGGALRARYIFCRRRSGGRP
jgi:hypothetical protein